MIRQHRERDRRRAGRAALPLVATSISGPTSAVIDCSKPPGSPGSFNYLGKLDMTVRTQRHRIRQTAPCRGSPSRGVAVPDGCGSSNDVLLNSQPAFVAGVVQRATFDGSSNDLLTAGLGKTGLQSAVSPTINDALNPTAAELRRLAIYNNYRALVDITTNGGFGVLFGPNVDANGVVGKVKARSPVPVPRVRRRRHGQTECHHAGADSGDLQRPSPCIVTAASSGSRGVYGAIATAGEWGLKKVAPSPTPTRAPATARTTAANTVFDMFGRPTTATAGAQFVATRPLALPPITVSRSNMPIHSRTRKDWGKFTLQAVKFAFFALNEELAPK